MGTLSIIGFAFLILETLVGTVANGFIVLVSCIEWFRSRKLSPNDLILTWLGLSRLMWHATVMLQVTMCSFFLSTYVKKDVYTMINMLWFFTYNVNAAMAALLGILYFVKITTFSHPMFLQVKRRFSGLVPQLLLGSVTLYTFMTLTMIVIRLSSSDVFSCDPSTFSVNNSSYLDFEVPRSCKLLVFSVTAPAFIPSAIFLLSIILLIISLWKHMRHLQRSGISTQDLNTSVHLTAIKSLASFAVLYFSSFVAVMLQTMLILRSIDDSSANVPFHTVGAVYPSGHAIILIVINPKLKQAWVRMIHHLRRQASETPS